MSVAEILEATKETLEEVEGQVVSIGRDMALAAEGLLHVTEATPDEEAGLIEGGEELVVALAEEISEVEGPGMTDTIDGIGKVYGALVDIGEDHEKQKQHPSPQV